MHASHLQTGHLGWIIAGAILCGFALVLGLMASLLLSNRRHSVKARAAAAQARADERQRLRDSGVHDLRPLLQGAAASPLRVDVQADAGAVPVLAVEGDLRQLFAEIAAQAGRVLDSGTTLHVSVRREARQAVVHWRRLGGAADAIAALCQRVAARQGGRIYCAPHDDDGALGLTLRLPLAASEA